MAPTAASAYLSETWADAVTRPSQTVSVATLRRLAANSTRRLQSRWLRRGLKVYTFQLVTFVANTAALFFRPRRWPAALTDSSVYANHARPVYPAKHTTSVKIETIKPNNMALLFIILFAAIGAFILISEIVKQAEEIDALHMVIEQDEQEIRLYKNELSSWKGNLKEVTYEGDLFINGSLHTGKNGCMVINGGLTQRINESGYSDDWRDACFEAPNILREDMNLEGQLVIVYGDVYVWLEATKDPGSTGFIACNAFTPHNVLDASHGGGGSKS